NLKRATSNGGPYTTVATGVTVASYSNTGLITDTTYYYVVSAVNAAGESANSSQATGTTFKLRWEFNTGGNTEGWINGGGFTSVSQDYSGSLVATGSAAAAWIYNPNVGNLGYKGKTTDQLRVRVSPTGGGNSHNMKIWFKPGASSTWAEVNAIRQDYTVGSGQWVDVIFPIGGVSGWAGQTISQLRINFDEVNLPFLGVTGWKIDYIRIE
ncbi:MAG: fibronectin type III domain-containing protein, partial [Verrucomicrobiota bacterium]